VLNVLSTHHRGTDKFARHVVGATHKINDRINAPANDMFLREIRA